MASNTNEMAATAQTQEPHPLFTIQPTATPTTTTSDVNSNNTNTPTSATTTTSPPVNSSSSTSSPPKTILLINGPNLNLLGYREPSIYGSTKLAEIESHLGSLASSRGIQLLTFQSNHEGAIVDRIHEAFWANLKRKDSASETGSETEVVEGTVDGIIINPGAYTHTSVAIRDALAGAAIKFVECHISNVHAREAFRHHSYLSDKAEAVIAGLGVYGYAAALDWWCWKWKGGKLEDAGM